MVSHGGTNAFGLMVGIEVCLLCAPFHHHVWRVRDEWQSFSTDASEKADEVKHLSGGAFVAKAGHDGVHANQGFGRKIDRRTFDASAESLPGPEACAGLRDCTRRLFGDFASLHLFVWFRALEPRVML